jgi:hypothetical protein
MPRMDAKKRFLTHINACKQHENRNAHKSEIDIASVLSHIISYLIVQFARAKQAAVVEAFETHAPEIVLFRIVGERAEVLGDERTHLGIGEKHKHRIRISKIVCMGKEAEREKRRYRGKR